MTEFALALSLGWRRWLRLAVLAALIVLFLLGMTYPLEVWNRAIDWFNGGFAHINNPWEEFTWFL